MYNTTIVGGGLVGLATARELLLRGVQRVCVLEAEQRLALHQSGRNSGVVHAGIYYRPGSLKAKLCVEGLRRSYAYFDQKGIAYRKVGKLIVALREEQVPALQRIYANALENDVPHVKFLDSNLAIRDVEPECGGVAAIHSPDTGIVEWNRVAEHYADDIRRMGGEVRLGCRVVGLNAGKVSTISVAVQGKEKKSELHRITSNRVVTCVGTHSDRVARLSSGPRYPLMIPIRGEYLTVTNQVIASRIRGNIYPVPDPNVPFLGVHFTPTMDGKLIVGPNAVLAFARDGYSYSKIRIPDLWETLSSKGFWRLALKNYSYALGETYRSLFIRAAAARARQYVPNLSVTDFCRAGSSRSGVRGQAIDLEGHLLDDFSFEEAEQGGILHTRNAPSPGATSSLSIARVIADRVLAM